MQIKELLGIHNSDARSINSIIKGQIIDVTITSPPYFDLKDYGYKEQIGYGQAYQDYLNDLKLVFQNVYNCTKDSGTLWVIIDTYKRDGEVITLPFDFSNKIKEVGWKLQEIIIWGKDRTLPWTHKGQMRNLFEYILVFSKSENYNFYIDQIRDFESLKKWWVKYPERYNPKGKTPEAIWHFDIPVQGSWGNGYISHFCPLPEDMISQILKLTTKEGDIVLDPFAGSGAVLAKADNMKRNFIGFELNSEYIKMFQNYLHKTGDQKRKEYEVNTKNTLKQEKFKKLIINLRVLKYAKILLKKVKEKKYKILKVYVEKLTISPKNTAKLIKVHYYLFVTGSEMEEISNITKEITVQVPLSKFGIEPSFSFISNINDFLDLINNKSLYTYTEKITHKYANKFDVNKNFNSITDIILSDILVDLNESDYE